MDDDGMMETINDAVLWILNPFQLKSDSLRFRRFFFKDNSNEPALSSAWNAADGGCGGSACGGGGCVGGGGGGPWDGGGGWGGATAERQPAKTGGTRPSDRALSPKSRPASVRSARLISVGGSIRDGGVRMACGWWWWPWW